MTTLSNKSFEFDPKADYEVFPEGEAVVIFEDFEEINSVQINGRSVKRLRTTFKSDDGKEIHHNMLMIAGKKYLPYQLIYAITRKYDSCDIGDLLGYPVVVNVVHNRAKDGIVYANVDAIYPYNQEEWEYEDDYEEDSCEVIEA